MPSFGVTYRGDVDRMESSGHRSILFWDTNLGSHLTDIVEAGYIDTCTVIGGGVAKDDLGPQDFN